MIARLKRLFGEDRWIPGLFVGFFIFLACVEALLITLSVNSFSGLSEADPYRRGLAYNDTIAERRKERDLGWRVSIGFEPEGALRGIIKIAARDAQGAELKGAEITATAERPMEGKPPQLIKLSALEDGAAEGALAVDTPGRWFVRVKIEDAGTSIERRREIFIEPQ